MRELPEIDQGLPAPTRPISFVCVRFSDEFEHNAMVSDCVHDPLNEFIVIDNRSNLYFQTLGQAMNAGIEQARHELIVVLHEDVLLLPGWQSLFEQSLNALERDVPDWLFLGVIGWRGSDMLGCCSDPRTVYNPEWRGDYEEVDRVDEQLLIFKKNSGVLPDSELPTIHNYGKDLIQQVKQQGQKSFVIRAPSVHKFADANGKPTLGPQDSTKIVNRQNTIYKLHKFCSDEYIGMKWPKQYPQLQLQLPEIQLPQHDTNRDDTDLLARPVILLGNKQSLLTASIDLEQIDNLALCVEEPLIEDNAINLPAAVLKALFREYQCPNKEQKKQSIAELTNTAQRFLNQHAPVSHWGFACENSAFVLPALIAAFPNATLVSIPNQATDTELIYEETFLTNELGRTLLTEATVSMAENPAEALNASAERLSEKIHLLRETTVASYKQSAAKEIIALSEFINSIDHDSTATSAPTLNRKAS